MFENDFNNSWYERRWLTQSPPPRQGRIARLLARLGESMGRGPDPSDVSWRIPPM